MFQSCHNDVKLPVGTTNERMKTRNNSLKKLHKSRSLKADDLTKGRTNGKFWAHLPWLLLKTLCQSTWIPTTKTLQQPALCLAKCNIDTISDVNLKCPPFNLYQYLNTFLTHPPTIHPLSPPPSSPQPVAVMAFLDFSRCMASRCIVPVITPWSSRPSSNPGQIAPALREKPEIAGECYSIYIYIFYDNH